MSDIAIRVESLGKQYRIGGPRDRYRTFRETLSDAAAARMRQLFALARWRVTSRRAVETIWALKDVSFEVKTGEVIGIIGRNGAGKSTLLKILSRITEPTAGYADIHGRVASLLEVGTGFHPELTGRENIYLNGAILGMRRAEIERKFDEIVAFAEVERFIDTPVKRYSSGMYLRLAFAVAAHLERDILVVDEVLAVGDAAFQEKCLGKMNDVAQHGRTVLFVSHNMFAVEQLCTWAVLLKQGELQDTGRPSELIRTYLAEARTTGQVSTTDWHDRETTGEGRLEQFDILDPAGEPTASIPFAGRILFRFHVDLLEPVIDPCFGVIIHDALGQPLVELRSIHSGLRLGRVHGRVTVTVCVDTLTLYPGRYYLSPWIMDAACTRDVNYVKLCCSLEVEPRPGPYGDLKLDPQYGKYWIPSRWMSGGVTAHDDQGTRKEGPLTGKHPHPA